MKHQIVWMCYFAAAMTGWAQTAAQFPLDGIVVEGHDRGAARLIVSESRLEVGKTYGERELRAAVDRVQRLPFILRADFQIRKGKSQGFYELVIRVETQSRIFGEIASSYNRYEQGSGGSWDDKLSLGVNHFFGKYLQAYAVVKPGWDWSNHQRSNGPVSGAVGLTSHRVAGTNLLLNFQIDVVENRTARFESLQANDDNDPTLNLNASYYLGKNQWIQSGITRSKFASEIIFPPEDQRPSLERSNESVVYSLAWERNTTNDSWEPTKGSIIRTILSHSKRESKEIGTVTDSSRSRSVGISAEKNVNLNQRHIFTLGSELGYGESELGGVSPFSQETEIDFLSGQMRLTYKTRLMSSLLEMRHGQAFAGASGGLHWSRTDSESFPRQTRDSQWLGAFLAYRNRWGIARLSFRYNFGD